MSENEKHLLIVDDTPANLDILVDALGDDFFISVAIDGKGTIDALEEKIPDLILLDIMMPGMDGYQVLETMQENPVWKKIPVIFLTAMSDIQDKTKGLQMGAVDYITKPFEMLEVQARVKTQLTLKDARDFLDNQNSILENRVLKRTEELQMTRDVTIAALASLAETRDNETGGHIKRTQKYLQILAIAVRNRGWYLTELDDQYIDLCYKSAPLHDIGKVGIRDAILLKPEKLSEKEFSIMQEHTILGFESLDRAGTGLPVSNFLNIAKEIALTHHEKWDGTGYPHGLKEYDIPIAGRLMALADVYDALISKRVYKPPFTHSKAVELIQENSGSHFDPEICNAFMDIHENFRSIALDFTENEEERNLLMQ